MIGMFTMEWNTERRQGTKNERDQNEQLDEDIFELLPFSEVYETRPQPRPEQRTLDTAISGSDWRSCKWIVLSLDSQLKSSRILSKPRRPEASITEARLKARSFTRSLDGVARNAWSHQRRTLTGSVSTDTKGEMRHRVDAPVTARHHPGWRYMD